MSGRAQFEEEKRRIAEDILAMSIRIEENLRKAMAALKDRDRALAEQVKADDPAVDEMQILVQDRCISIMATQQPVARDLRWLVSCIKIVDQMERIGDHAVHLAKAVLKMDGIPSIRPLGNLERMAETGRTMFRGAVDAFLEQDAQKARAIATLDDKIDADHKDLVTELLAYLREHPDKAAQGTKAIQASGFMERLGDHATNICESTVYFAEGVHVELNA